MLSISCCQEDFHRLGAQTYESSLFCARAEEGHPEEDDERDEVESYRVVQTPEQELSLRRARFPPVGRVGSKPGRE